MLSTIYMPWWAWGYLIITLVVFILSLSVDKECCGNKIFSSILSLFTISISVVGFFNNQVVEFFGLFILPMVALGIFWELTRSVQESEIAQDMLDKDLSLTDGERNFLMNAAIAFNAIIVVPGYVMGLILCFNVLGFTFL